ncbi:LexA family protein [Pantoea allii]|uniref:LexA family protein n=1 Tax=Pantoea allii TaxID=574096 RepID=UPI003D31BCC2
MEQLTNTQQRTLDFIRGYIGKNRISPTILEIAHGMGWSSGNAASEHVNALERKGFIRRVKRASRGITITSQGNSYDIDSVALDAATRIMAVMRTAALDKHNWPDVRLKAAIQVEVIRTLQARGNQ